MGGNAQANALERGSAGLWLWLCVAGLAGAPAQAQIATDGSVGGPAQTLTGPAFQIPNTLGSQVGSNLFHSFSDFNINTGESASFTSDFAGVTDNVISRITGANPSNIDGLLQSTIPGADLWMLNPNGIVFGENAALNVPGSFHAATADYLGLADGGRFGADLADPANNVLTVAAPATFGFLDSSVGLLSVTAPPGSGAELAVPQGETLSLTGRLEKAVGPILTDAGIENATLRAPGGRIELISVRSAGEVAIGAGPNGDPVLSGFFRFGNLEMIDSTLEVTGNSTGRVFLFGDIIDIDNTLIDGRTGGAADGADVDIRARVLQITNGSVIDTSTSSTGNAGDIDIRGAVSKSRTINVNGAGSRVSSSSSGTGPGAGDAGTIVFWSERSTIADEAEVTVKTVDGNGGRINLIVENLNIDSDATVNASTSGAGNGGAIDIGGSVVGTSGWPDLTFGTLFQTSTFTVSIAGGSINLGTSGTGDAGQLVIVADESVILSALNPDQTLSQQPSGILSESSGTEAGLGAPAGKSGTLVLFAPQVTLNNQARISMSTVDGAPQVVGSPAGTGTIAVNMDLLQMNEGTSITAATSGAGDGGSILIGPIPAVGGPATLDMNGGIISTSATGSGDAGLITIVASNAGVSGDGNQGATGIFSNSSLTGASAGAAGTININATALTVDNGASLSVSTVDGDSGSIGLDVDQLSVNSGATITAATAGAGDGGTIDVSDDVQFIELLGGAITTSTSGSGNAGTLEIGTAGNAIPVFVIRGPGAAVRSGSSANGASAGAAGTVVIHAGNLLIDDGGLVSVQTIDGQGGSVQLDATALNLLDSAAVLAGTTGAGDGGSIQIAADLATVNDSNIAATTTGSGQGGTVRVDANSLEVDNATITTSASGLGNAGRIDIGSVNSSIPSVVVSGPDGSIRSASTATGIDAGAAGTVNINATALTVDNGASLSVSTVDGDSGSIGLDVDQLSVNSGATITAATAGAGDGGTIDVSDEVQFIELLGGAITTSTSGSGNAGTLEIGTADNTIPDFVIRGPEAAVRSDSSANGASAGAAGTVVIHADNLLVDDGGLVSVQTIDGQGGSVQLDTTALNILGSAAVLAGTTGAGDGGSIQISSDLATVNDSNIAATTSGSGQGGAIQLDATALNLLDGAAIRAGSTGTGDGGSIEVTADLVAMTDSNIAASTTDSGQGGTVRVDAVSLQVDNATITTSASGSGNAGRIDIGSVNAEIPSVIISGTDGSIRSASTATGIDAGAAGTVTIVAGALVLTEGGDISASTVDGIGGAVDVTATNSLSLNGGEISTSTLGIGDAGSINVQAGNVIINGDPDIRTGIFSESGSEGAPPAAPVQAAVAGPAGAAGNILVGADRINLNDSGQVSVRSFADGNAGSVTMNALSIDLRGNSSINAQTEAGSGGSVVIGVTDFATLTDSDILAFSASGDAASQGNIFIGEPQLVLLQNSRLRAQSANEAGGNVTIISDVIIFDGNSTIEASGAIVTIGQVLATALEIEEAIIADAPALQDERCARNWVANRSTFTVNTVTADAFQSEYLSGTGSSAPAARSAAVSCVDAPLQTNAR